MSSAILGEMVPLYWVLLTCITQVKGIIRDVQLSVFGLLSLDKWGAVGKVIVFSHMGSGDSHPMEEFNASVSPFEGATAIDLVTVEH